MADAMTRQHDRASRGPQPDATVRVALGPGRTTLAEQLPAQARGSREAAPRPVQRSSASWIGLMAPRAAALQGGEALPDPVRGKMDTAFAADFSSVRVQRDSREAQRLGADAFAAGNAVHFAPGRYDPDGRAGQELIGHELAHVVQQAEGRVAAPAQGRGVAIAQDAALEREADELGARAAQGLAASSRATVIAPGAPVALQGARLKLDHQTDELDVPGERPPVWAGRVWYLLGGIHYLASAFPDLEGFGERVVVDDEGLDLDDDPPLDNNQRTVDPEPKNPKRDRDEVVEPQAEPKRHQAVEPKQNVPEGHADHPLTGRALVLSALDLQLGAMKVARPTDIRYTERDTMNHKIPRHALDRWFVEALTNRDLEKLQKLAVISNRPMTSYFKAVPEGVAIRDVVLFKAHATWPRWNLFEGPLVENRADDTRDKLDGHYGPDGRKTPRSTVAQTIFDQGIDAFSVAALREMVEELNARGLATESPLDKTEWRNDADEVGGKGPKYQWHDPRNAEVKLHVAEAQERRRQEVTVEDASPSQPRGYGNSLSALLAHLQSEPAKPDPVPRTPRTPKVKSNAAPRQPQPQAEPKPAKRVLKSRSELDKIAKKLPCPPGNNKNTWKKKDAKPRAKAYLDKLDQLSDEMIEKILTDLGDQLSPDAWTPARVREELRDYAS
jgi:hypothetical protein